MRQLLGDDTVPQQAQGIAFPYEVGYPAFGESHQPFDEPGR